MYQVNGPRLAISAVRRTLGGMAKSLAASSGFVVLRRGEHEALIREIEDLYGVLVFPDLPAVSARTELLCRLIGTGVGQGLHLIDHLHATAGVEGDVCEFGVAQGATTALLANELLGVEDTRSIYLYDSFEGLPAPSESDTLINDIFNLGDIRRYEGKMAFPRSEVLRRLEDLAFPEQRINVVKGFVDSATHVDVLPKQVSFAYVDFDFYDPIAAALRLLHLRLSPGGIVVIDDYGWFSSGVKSAVQEFFLQYDDEYELTVGPEHAGKFAVLRRRRRG